MNEFGLLPFAPVLESLRIVMNVLLVGALLVILSEVIILLANLKGASERCQPSNR